MRKVNFVLDEAASLGHLEPIDDAVDKGRGFGLNLLLFYQSLGQLKKCFPEGQDQTLLSNVTQVFFGVNDTQTAEYVSGRLGEETIIVNSGGTSTGTTRQFSDRDGHGSVSYSRNSNDNWQQHGRKLLKPEEVMGLSPRVAITFAPGVPPICTTLIRYYEENPSSKWPQFKIALKTMGVSLLFFIAIGLLALQLAESSPRTEPPALRAEQGIWFPE